MANACVSHCDDVLLCTRTCEVGHVLVVRHGVTEAMQM